MGGALIEKEARHLKDEGRREAKREYAIEMALRKLKQGKLTIEEISEITKRSVAEIEKLKKDQTV